MQNSVHGHVRVLGVTAAMVAAEFTMRVTVPYRDRPLSSGLPARGLIGSVARLVYLISSVVNKQRAYSSAVKASSGDASASGLHGVRDDRRKLRYVACLTLRPL